MPKDPSYNPLEDEEFRGSLYEEYFSDSFVGSRSAEETQAIMQRIDREHGIRPRGATEEEIEQIRQQMMEAAQQTEALFMFGISVTILAVLMTLFFAYQKTIAETADYALIGGMATAVRLGRRAKGKMQSIKKRVLEKADS